MTSAARRVWILLALDLDDQVEGGFGRKRQHLVVLSCRIPALAEPELDGAAVTGYSYLTGYSIGNSL